ncbi:MAG: hypothetical protein QM820_16855 [Minicystis sp.]
MLFSSATVTCGKSGHRADSVCAGAIAGASFMRRRMRKSSRGGSSDSGTSSRISKLGEPYLRSRMQKKKCHGVRLLPMARSRAREVVGPRKGSRLPMRCRIDVGGIGEDGRVQVA